MSERAEERVGSGRHWAQDPATLIAVVTVLFVGIAALRVAVSSPRDAVGILFVVPIAALAARFGSRGGYIGVLVAVALIAITSAISDEPITAVGYVTRAAAFALVALVLGLLAERVDRARRFERQQLELSPLPVIEVERTGVIARANRAAQQLLSFTSQELVGKPLESLLPGRLHAAYEVAREEYLADPRFETVSEEVEMAVCDRDGTEIPVAVTLAPAAVASGLLVRITLIDIRKQVELEKTLRATTEELARSNAELAQFASIASHDLQEPLRTLSGFAQLLQRRHGEALDGDAQELVNYILESAKSMQDLINDLLTYSRVSHVELHPGTVDTSDVVKNVVGSLARAIDEAGADVIVDALPCVEADRPRLERVFRNLLSNAVKFRGSDRPRVEISAVQSGREWRFSVADNGIGIDPSRADRIFDVFERLHPRDEYHGTGMGLAICHRIVERHGGRIWVEPRPGGGSVFSFTLPIPTPPPASRARSS